MLRVIRARHAFPLPENQRTVLLRAEMVLAMVFGGVFAYPSSYRTAHLAIDEDGVIHSTTTCEFLSGLRNRYRDCDIPDIPWLRLVGERVGVRNQYP